MNNKKVWVTLIIASSLCQEIHTCSFLRRYGVNSYITNIPLFFKKENSDAPQKTNLAKSRMNTSVIIKNEPIIKAMQDEASPIGRNTMDQENGTIVTST